jgi:hypothetical protein
MMRFIRPAPYTPGEIVKAMFVPRITSLEIFAGH